VQQPSPGEHGAGNRAWDGSVDEVAVYKHRSQCQHNCGALLCGHNQQCRLSCSNSCQQSGRVLGLEEAAYVPPNPNTYPTVANSGSAGAGANGTASVGVFAAQSGPAYGGFGAGNNALNVQRCGRQPALADNPDVTQNLVATEIVTLMAWVKPSQLGDWRTIIVTTAMMIFYQKPIWHWRCF